MRARMAQWFPSWAGVAIWGICACSPGGGGGGIERGTPPPEEGSGNAGSGATGGISVGPDPGTICDPTASDSPCSPEAPPPPGCGDGDLTPDEACDDGGQVDGDGCAANCLAVDPGFSCQPPGQPCHQIARCGDGVVSLSELCDDGNVADGDGCSARCKLEMGFKCEGQPSTCSPTTCGDGLHEGAESCDDGNATPFDGCSANCTAEPECGAGACTSSCGDGLVIGEDCDDGNSVSGDGCSADCTSEPGFECQLILPECEQQNGACILRVPVIYRDFNADHSDFEPTCTTGAKGVVEPTLNADGKPVLADGSGVCIASAESFAEWYTNTASNSAIVGELVLYDNGNGGFVNRWGPNGEQWLGYINEAWAANDINTCLPDCIPCSWNPAAGCTATPVPYDGTPVFYPIDDAPGALEDMRYRARISDQYGYASIPFEDAIIPGAPPHNFHFTTEVIYWFQYDASASATLDFTGDDDVWVFVNGRLALDLGGLHPPESGTVTIDATTAATYDLEDGNVYRISIFHAERLVDGSSFKLTLAGFAAGRSDCVPVCGDGIVSLGEECDDGANDGGYGECDAGCVLGPYCGDGIVQEGEDCDDGNRLEGDSCGSACRILVVK